MLFTRTNTFKIVSSIRKTFSLLKLSKFNFVSSSNDKDSIQDSEDFINTKKLVELIDSEIQSQENSYDSIDSEKKEFLDKNRWVLFEKTKSNEKNLYIELKKSTSEFDISVKFASKPPEVIDSTKDNSEPERYIDFYITLTRNNKKSGIFIEAVTIDSSVNVNQIHFSENISQYSENFLASKVIENYTGPEFGTLDEKLQQEFLDLFTGLGINDELGSFIEVVAVDKDERLHVDWMKNTKNILI